LKTDSDELRIRNMHLMADMMCSALETFSAVIDISDTAEIRLANFTR